MNPRTLARWTFRLSLLIAGVGAVYFYWRYDVLTLPRAGCSPLLRFAPGDRLLLDRWLREWHKDQAVLYRSPEDGSLQLAKIAEVRHTSAGTVTQVWLVVDDPTCAGQGSETHGWIGVQAVQARVLSVWPW